MFNISTPQFVLVNLDFYSTFYFKEFRPVPSSAVYLCTFFTPGRLIQFAFLPSLFQSQFPELLFIFFYPAKGKYFLNILIFLFFLVIKVLNRKQTFIQS